MQYSDSIKKIIPDYEPDTDVPILLTVDFNINVQGNQSLLEFEVRVSSGIRNHDTDFAW
jgi:hypothetical protein